MYKVGDKFILIDADRNNLHKEWNGRTGVIISISYNDEFNAPEASKYSRDRCVYGYMFGDNLNPRAYFRLDCIRPLTPLEELL